MDVKLLNISSHVYNYRNNLWNQAIEKGGDSTDKIMTLFIKNIIEIFKENGRSLKEVSSDLPSRRVLCQSRRLHEALKIYDRVIKKNQDQVCREEKLIDLAREVYMNTGMYSQVAEKLSGGNSEKQLFTMTMLIRSFLRSHGRSLREINRSKKAKMIFEKSGRLKTVLEFYEHIFINKNENKQTNPNEKREKEFYKEAERLAYEHGKGNGLLTHLGLEDKINDKKELKRAVLNILRENHPDKNLEGDRKLVRDANAILDMMKNGTFEKYRELIKSLRG